MAESARTEATAKISMGHLTAISLWFAVTAGLVLSVMSALHICSEACSETAKFTIFGVDFGWFGVAFFCVYLLILGLRNRSVWADRCFSAFTFACVGAELRFIWIQKFIIGTWCPICLSIAAAVFTAAAIVAVEKHISSRATGGNMKNFLKFLATTAVMVAIGAAAAFVGVESEAEAAPPGTYLGDVKSPVTVYFVSDWFCPVCRKIEPEIEKIYPEVAKQARVAFVDFAVHKETLNFTPFNLQFLTYEKSKYIPLRKALNDLSNKTKAPTAEEVQAAVNPLGVKLRQVDYADTLYGMQLNLTIIRGFDVKATPTVVIANNKTNKNVKLVGDREISRQAILNAIASVGK